MAEVIETNNGMTSMVGHQTVPSNSKTNAALTLGIIGTALAGMAALGNGRSLLGYNNYSNGCNGNWNNGYGGYNGWSNGPWNGGNWNGGFWNGVAAERIYENDQKRNAEEVYLERHENAAELNEQKRFYEGYISTMNNIHKDFDEAKQRDIDNSFQLYKYTRDEDDKIKLALAATADHAATMTAIVNDKLTDKINNLQNKVDIMCAVRPYQDALINEHIDKNAIIADYNLHRRTCRMIQGELILPSTTTVGGYESYSYWNTK